MAAIIDTRRPARPAMDLPPRPALRLVASDGRTIGESVDLGFRTVHLVVAVAAFALLLVLSLAIGNGTFAGAAPGPSATGSSAATSSIGGGSVEVQAGDSLWTVARRLQPTGDVRALVDQLLTLNGSAPLQVGQVLTLPA